MVNSQILQGLADRIVNDNAVLFLGSELLAGPGDGIAPPSKRGIARELAERFEYGKDDYSLPAVARDSDVPYFDETKITLTKMQGCITQPASLATITVTSSIACLRSPRWSALSSRPRPSSSWAVAWPTRTSSDSTTKWCATSAATRAGPTPCNSALAGWTSSTGSRRTFRSLTPMQPGSWKQSRNG